MDQVINKHSTPHFDLLLFIPQSLHKKQCRETTDFYVEPRAFKFHVDRDARASLDTVGVSAKTLSQISLKVRTGS